MYALAEREAVDASRLEGLVDDELVRMFRLGHKEAVRVLLHRHTESLFRFCCYLTASPEDAEDICQETVARAMARVDSLRSGSSFRSWLFGIARNLSVDSHRTRKRMITLSRDEECSPVMICHDNPGDHVVAREEHQTVAEALGRLARNHQTVLMMREVEGMSYADIARRMDVSQSAVETLLFRARRRLKDEYLKKATSAPAFTLVGIVRGLLSQLAAPFAAGTPLAAKVAATSLAAGGVFAVPQVAPMLTHSGPGHRIHARTMIRTSLVGVGVSMVSASLSVIVSPRMQGTSYARQRGNAAASMQTRIRRAVESRGRFTARLRAVGKRVADCARRPREQVVRMSADIIRSSAAITRGFAGGNSNARGHALHHQSGIASPTDAP
jgi:RNA polymerase sigma-70 factor (ECF subfamily)